MGGRDKELSRNQGADRGGSYDYPVELPPAPDNRKGGASYRSGLHDGSEAIQRGAPECIPSSRYP